MSVYLGTEDDSLTSDPTGYEHPVQHNRVLIVDDHASFRSIAREVLTADGFLVVGEAADGAEAIRACGELRPDLVLLDVQLPDIDGFAVAAVLTTRIDPPAVVLVSSRARTDYGSRMEYCRAYGYIAKAELSGDAVRRLLHNSESSATPRAVTQQVNAKPRGDGCQRPAPR